MSFVMADENERKINLILLIQKSDDLSIFKNKEVRSFLKYFELPSFGNKAELIERVSGAKRLKLDQLEVEPKADANSNTNSNTQRNNEHERLKTPLGELLPNPTVVKSGWQTDSDKFPQFSWNELYNYLVLNKQRTFDFDALKANKELKAQIFYKDGHIQNVMYNDIEHACSHCFVKCECLPSVPTKDVKKKPAVGLWVCLAKYSGRVHSAFCECVSGTSECCNHVAALLFALIDLNEKRSSGKLAPTSTACSWIKPRKRCISPKTAQNLYKRSKSNNFSVSNDLSTNSDVSVTVKHDENNRKQNFRQKLMQINSRAAWLQNFSDEGRNQEDQNVGAELIPKLHNVKFLYADHVDLRSKECTNFFTGYMESLKIDSSICVEIEKASCGQSNNNVWHAVRNGRLTSSKFGSIVRRLPTTSPDNLLKYLFGYVPKYTGKQVEHGLRYESVARDAYVMERRKSHPPLSVRECGFLVSDRYPYLGTSPDGFVSCAHCVSNGILEIKCPFAFRDSTPTEACNSQDFFCALHMGSIVLKRNHQYYYQIQGQLGISGRKWCDFVVWTFKGLSVERIEFDHEFWMNMLEKLKNFYIDAYLPELFSERVKRQIPLHGSR